MNTPAIAIIATLTVVYALAAFLVWRRDHRHTQALERLAVFAELDAHLDEHAAGDPDLWNAFGSGSGWDAQAGLDRLRQAIRDEHTKGDNK